MMICTPYITLRNGKVLHASAVGKKAFCFEVSEEKQKEYQEKKNKRKQD